MNTNNNIAPIIEEQEEQNTVQELPKQKEKSGILKKITNLITSVALTTMVILTPQKSAKSEGTKLQDNLKMKPLKSNSLVMAEKDSIHEENLKVLEKVSIGEEIKKSLVGLSDENRKLRQEGKSYLESPVKIQTTTGIKSREDLNFIVNSGALAPAKTFEEITGIDSLIRKDKDGNILIDDQFFKEWEMVVGKLFDTSDIGKWLRTGEDRKELTKDQIKAYKEDMAKAMERWKTKINYWYAEMNKWDKENGKPEGTTFQIFFEDGLNLFENAIKNTNFQSREILRRQEVNAFSIAYYKVAKPSYRAILRPDVVNQVSEYVLLMNKEVIAVKTQMGKFKYLTLDGKILKNIEGLEPIQDIFIEAVSGYKQEYIDVEYLAKTDIELKQAKEKNAQLDKNIAKLDKDNAQLDKDNAQLDKDNAQLDKDNAQLDKDNAQLDKDNAQLDKLNSLSKEVLELSALYTQTSDKKYLKKAQENIEELKKVKIYLADMNNREKNQRLKNKTKKAISNLEMIINKFNKNYGNLVASI